MFNALTADLATGLSTAICKDGQTTVTANIPMGGFKITGLAAGTFASHAARVDQIQNSSTTVLTSVSGTDTVLGTATPTPSAYASGQVFTLVPANTNTGATTLNVSSLGAKNVFYAGAACTGGELVQSIPTLVEYDGTQFNVLAAPRPVNRAATVLTTGRLPLVTTSGVLTDSVNFLYQDTATARQITITGGGTTQNIFTLRNTDTGTGDAIISSEITGNGNTGHAILATQSYGGDAFVRLLVDTLGSTTYWSFGGDNSDSDKWVLSQNSTLGTNNRIEVTQAGAVTLVATGTHTINGPVDISGASAGRLIFPASQNASTNANTLDDYEEGTWTVSFTFGTVGDLALSAETKEAYYIKVGKQVFVYWNYTFTPTFTTSAGNATLTGLPFTHQNNTNNQAVGRGTLRHNVRLTYSAGCTMVGCSATNNNTTVALVQQGSATAAASLTTANFTTATSTDLHGSFTFEASA